MVPAVKHIPSQARRAANHQTRPFPEPDPFREALTFAIGVKQAGLGVTPRLRTIARLLSSFDELARMWLYWSGFRYGYG